MHAGSARPSSGLPESSASRPPGAVQAPAERGTGPEAEAEEAEEAEEAAAAEAEAEAVEAEEVEVAVAAEAGRRP